MGISKQAEKEYKKKLEEQKISSYDESVNPLKETDLTTFYSNLNDCKLSNLNEISEMLKKLQNAEDIVHKLNSNLLSFKITNDNDKVDWCTEYIFKLRELCLQRMTEFTSKIAIVPFISLRILTF